MNRLTSNRNGIHRRDLLRLAPLSLMSLGASAVLATEAAAGNGKHNRPLARQVIMIWLAGGPATIDMWDLKPHNSRVRGEFEPIATSAEGVQICEHLPKMAMQMHECTLVRSVTHTIAEHEQGTEYVLTGNPLSPALKYPSMGSVVSTRMDDDQHATASPVPAYIDLSGLEIGKSGYLGPSHDPFVVGDFSPASQRPARDQLDLPPGLTVADLDRRSKLLSKLERGFDQFDDDQRAAAMLAFQQRAAAILSSGRARKALDLSRESATLREQYGAGLGQSALAARRLIEAGARFVTIGMGGWDTHSDNFAQLRDRLLPQLDAALSSLLSDLKSRGLLEETVVYCVGEFNRTPAINSQGGRDHWARSMSVLIAGGGFKGGFVYGATDNSGLEPSSDACSPADINATILNQLGIPPDTLLTTRSGRPIQVFRSGKVLSELT